MAAPLSDDGRAFRRLHLPHRGVLHIRGKDNVLGFHSLFFACRASFTAQQTTASPTVRALTLPAVDIPS